MQKFKLPRIPVRITLIVIAFVLGIILTLSSFTFLRHRQLCSYQQAISSGQLITNSDKTLCPNITDISLWPQAILNAFSINATNNLSINTNAINELTPEDCTDELNPRCWIGDSKPSLKQNDGFTNFLLVGSDSTGSRSRTQRSTDTIMLVSYQHDTGKIMLISFPRDLYVYYRRPNGVNTSYKINAIYAIDDVEGLNSVISQLTNKPIHYYAYINMDLFRQIVDALGGVDINLSEPFSDGFPCAEVPRGVTCPSPRYGYGTFTFPAGMNHFDSFQAMVYARSRHYSSDYARAQRQQNLVRAIMENIINSKKPLGEQLQTYLNLYNVFRQEVTTNIEVSDLAGLFAIVSDINTDAISLVVSPELNASAGMVKFLGILPDVGWSIGFRDTSNRQFQNFISNIWDNLAFYTEQPRILVIKDIDAQITPEVQAIIDQHPQYTTVVFMEKDIDSKGIRLYDLSGNKKSSVRELQKMIPGSLSYNAKLEGITKSDQNEDILLILGK